MPTNRAIETHPDRSHQGFAPEPTFQFDKIEALYNEGQYLQALKLGETLFGPYRNWQGVELQTWSARIANNLGMRRTAHALFIRCWRGNQQHPLACYYYARTLTIRKGSLAALQFMESNDEPAAENPALKAKWLAYKARLLAHFRDFENATLLLSSAQSIAPNNTRVILDQAYVLEAQDQYQASFLALEPLVTANNFQRDAVQQAAYLMIITGKTAKAIHLLMRALKQFESISITFQLLDLLMECQLYNKVPAVLSCADQYLFESSPETHQRLAAIKSNLAYFNQNIPLCIEFAKQNGAIFYQTIADNLCHAQQQSPGRLQRVLLDVPFVRQHYLTCAPATLTALCRYWQIDFSQEAIKNSICYNGTPGHAERQWASEHGFFVVEFELQLQAIKHLINAGIPVTLATEEPGNAHLQAITGYDEIRGVYLVRDSYSPKLQEFLIEKTAIRYAPSGPRCMAFVPEEKAQQLKEFPLPHSKLYDHYYQLVLELENHQPNKASQQLREMLALDPNHRLTVSAQRHMSHYENDQSGILVHIEKLLQRYPGDINLISAKINTMRVTSTSRERTTYLENLCVSLNASPHLLILLADEIKFDHRKNKRTETLYKKILRHLPTHSKALNSYADLMWNQRRFENGLFLYRLATCLDDKEEQYAENYFKAATHRHQKEQALQFLRKRYEQYQHQSTAPARSYCRALEATGKHHTLIAVIDKMVALHPNDGRFIVFAADVKIQNGEIEQAKALLKKAEGCSHKHDFLPVLATLYQHLGQNQKCSQLLEEILETDPLNTNAIKNLVRHKMEQGQEEEAFDLIDKKIACHPSNKFLLHLKIQWIETHHLHHKEQALRQCLAQYPNDLDALCELGENLTLQNKTIDALPYYIKAQSIAPKNIHVLEMLGKYYLTTLDLISAQRYFQEAIHTSVDQARCFDSLLQSATDIQGKKTQLQYIYDALIEQSIFGETILDYYNLARIHLDSEVLLLSLKNLFNEKNDLYQVWIAFIHFQTSRNELEYALGLAQQATENFPLIPRIWVELAEIYRLSCQFDLAEQSLQQSLSISPHWSKAVYQLADLYELQGEYPKAIALLQTAIKAQPFNPTLYGSLAQLLWKENASHEAVALIQKAVQNAPSYIWGWEKLQQWSQQINKPEIARTTALQLVTDYPHDPEHWTLLAYVTDNPNQKMAALHHAINIAPLSIAVNSALIRCLANQSRFEEAHQLCHHPKWLDKAPTEIKAYSAWLYTRENKTVKAITLMQQALKSDPSFYDGWQLLSDWSEQENQPEQAIQYANQCLKLKPHNPSTLCFCAEKYLNNAPKLTSPSDLHNDTDNGLQSDLPNSLSSDSQTGPPRPPKTRAEVNRHHFKDKAQALLKKAFQLDPSDQYNSLTYIDLLTDQEEYGQATEVIKHFKLYNKSPHLLIRQLKIACLLEQHQDAMDFWYGLLNTNDDSAWLFDTAFQLVQQSKHEADYFNEVIKVLQQTTINPLVGSVWARHYLTPPNNQHQITSALRHLPTLKKHPAVFVQAIETLIQYFLDHKQKIPRRLLKQCPAPTNQVNRLDLQKWGKVFQLVLLSFIAHAQWKQAAQWSRQHWPPPHEQPPETEPWVLYYFSLSLRQLGQWQEAEGANSHAYKRSKERQIATQQSIPEHQQPSQQPPIDFENHHLKDDCIKIWFYFDTLLSQENHPDASELASINVDLLPPLERYIFWLNSALIHSRNPERNVEEDHLGKAPLEGDHREDNHPPENNKKTTNALKNAELIYQDLERNTAAHLARKKAHQILIPNRWAKLFHSLKPHLFAKAAPNRR